ncbi:hypothetical protein [Nocardia sp. MW-W600-9]
MTILAAPATDHGTSAVASEADWYAIPDSSSPAPVPDPEVPVPSTRAFLTAIGHIAIMFDLDRRAAKRAFRDVLDLATDADWDLLDYLVDVFTLHPYQAALRRLRARWIEGDELERERLVELVPDTDPGLHCHDDQVLDKIAQARAAAYGTSVDEEIAKLHVQLEVAEMPRQPMRYWRSATSRLHLTPSRDTDASRLSPEQIRARLATRGKRRRAEVEPDHVTDYVAESLFVDTDFQRQDRLRRKLAALVARGVSVIGEEHAPRGWVPRYPGEPAPKPAELTEAIWDHQYGQFVAHQHTLDRALAGAPVKSLENSMVWAQRRTGLASRTDRRDTGEYYGSSIDDVAEAMIPVHGWRCVSCFVERPAVDQRPLHHHDGLVRSDDGLCDHCRADGALGLAPLPEGFGLGDLAAAYCAYFAEHYPRAARALIAEVARRAPEWMTQVLDRFLLEHPDLPGAPAVPERDASDPVPAPRSPRRGRRELPAGMRHGRCEGCTQCTPIHDDGFCTKCRVWLGLHTPAATTPAAV